MQGCTSRQSGLTLIEVMAVLAVSGLLLGGMWQFYHQSIRAYQRGLQEVRLTQGARTVLRLITRDVQKAFATAAPSGIQGMPPQPPATLDADRLELITTAYPVLGMPQRVRYVLEPAAAGGTHVLKRAVAIVGSRAAERVMPFGEGVHGLRLRYFDGQMWYDTWQRTSLPQALEITVVFHHRGGEARTHRFTTVVTAD
jgi:prepilin-type N-terminal cleavage/methylation domain-containing protein